MDAKNALKYIVKQAIKRGNGVDGIMREAQKIASLARLAGKRLAMDDKALAWWAVLIATGESTEEQFLTEYGRKEAK